MHDLPLTLVGGYLGSGKTTWINARLAAAGGVRFAVMVNDFGDLNVDAALIADQGAHTVELSNGCVCCSISGDMAAAAESVAARAKHLDWVLLEASGVADLTRLKQQVAHWPGFRMEQALTFADATRIRTLVNDKFVGAHVRTQLREADLVRLTHLDQIDAATEFKLESWLAELRAEHNADRAQVPDFAGDRIDGTRFTDRAALEVWLDAQPPTTQRIKGFVRFADGSVHLVQWRPGACDITPEARSRPLHLIRIAFAD